MYNIAIFESLLGLTNYELRMELIDTFFKGELEQARFWALQDNKNTHLYIWS